MKSTNKLTLYERTKRSAKEHPRLFVCYLVLRFLVIAVMVAQFVNGDYANVFLCILTLILFMIPTFVEKQIKIDVPDTLEVIILLFIFSAEILGEIHEYYLNVPGWDTMLHTINGFLCAAIGIALIDILNRHNKFSISMSPIFVSLVAFCFSMTIGVLWEFFEYAADVFLHTDMQKDTILYSISTVNLNPEGRNIPFIVSDISKTVIYGTVNGTPSEIVLNGYLDVGIKDTMKDMLVNFIGASVFSVMGYFYIKNRGKSRSSKFISRFLLTTIPCDENTDDTDSENCISTSKSSDNSK